MKTAYEWNNYDDGDNGFSKASDDDLRDVQVDALKWAAEQITTDGNPDVARDKIIRKIKEIDSERNV